MSLQRQPPTAAPRSCPPLKPSPRPPALPSGRSTISVWLPPFITAASVPPMVMRSTVIEGMSGSECFGVRRAGSRSSGRLLRQRRFDEGDEEVVEVRPPRGISLDLVEPTRRGQGATLIG